MKSPLPADTLAAFAGDDFRARIFYEKYAARDADNRQIETLPSQAWDRIAREIASTEPDEAQRTERTQRFRWLLDAYQVIPSRRIMVGAGNPRHPTLATCDILPVPPDSITPYSENPERTHSHSNYPLANVNLAAFVQSPFTPDAHILATELINAVRYTVCFLDNVLDYNADRHTLPAQREASLASRRIGVSFTGLADLFIQLGMRYDTDATLRQTDDLFRNIKYAAYATSLALAREKGPFPLFQPDRHLDNLFFQDFPPEFLDMLRTDGLRNVALLTIPPIGSEAALAGVTPGIDPVFAFHSIRRSESLPQTETTVPHPLVARYREITKHNETDPLPDTFLTAYEISPDARIALHAMLQKHMDQVITSTLNVPRETTRDTIARIYHAAWDAGCKGITVYREGTQRELLPSEDQDDTPIHTAEIALISEINRLIDAKVLPACATLSAAPTAQELVQLTQAVDDLLRNASSHATLSPKSRPIHPSPSVSVGPPVVQPTPEGNLQVTIALVLTIHESERFQTNSSHIPTQPVAACPHGENR